MGRSGVDVSRLILGGATIGGIGSASATCGKGLSDEEAFAVLDTANTYAGGHSEEVIGAWLALRPANDREHSAGGASLASR